MIDRPERPVGPHHRSGFRFSVIVPTYNRPTQLVACVGALRRVERPGGALEIVVVNDGGAPVPADLVASARAEDGRCEVRVIEQANAGPAAARNAGATSARGALLAFTDDDCRPDPAWLTAFDSALRAEPSALAGGRTINAIPSVFAETSQQLADFVSAYFDGGVHGRFFTSNNMAAARETFLAAGGFDASFPFAAGEDRELCDRWSSQSRPSVSVPDAIVHHAHQLSAPRFVRQHFTYGRGAVAFRRARAGAGRPVRVDPAFYLRSVVHPFTRSSSARALLIASLILVAHAAYGAGLFWEQMLGRTRSARSR